MKVVLASKNPHKLVEISQITEKFGMELVLESQLGVDIDVEETGSTFEENSFLKAEAVMKATGLPALADDSGICVDALGGEPGIYSARYGFDDSLDDFGRLQLLLKNTENVPDGQRQAQFVCVITFVTPDGKVIQARGEVHGELLRAPFGEGGFGYDPIFYYPPFGKSLAQVSPAEKNSVSHRANALKVFYEKLKEAGYADK
ncbi:MAG: RdgB/HAM1 family non-canonical purine NTP pyrophosphatase [Clostridiales bacterium]|nr:RdgB/HAM1 family non-canonical purine NTP pyrophosphatase [Clostridiales bacterium]MCI7573202.1 RdgB/HAM1 family non-canonical purine NTP pyrophosphatase [Clostridiales bacterium]MDY5643255.1 RdgB/HAM1 family non-canonical purine NTP pyrophosphatase [Candidatus Faecousia sp.]